MDKKITDTIDAKIITILGDHFEHDADAQAEAMLDIKATILAEIEKAIDIREVCNLEKTEENVMEYKRTAIRNNLRSEIVWKVRELLR